MKENSIQIEDLFLKIEKFFSIGGIWPTRPTYIKFSICIMYFVAYLSMAYADLFHVFGNLELTVMNLVESLVFTMTFPMVLMIRGSRSLKIVIATAKKDIATDQFENLDERKLYHTYNYISKMFLHISVAGIMTTITFFYFRPLLNFVMGNISMSQINDPFRKMIKWKKKIILFVSFLHSNDTTSSILPFRIRIFLDLNKTSTYTLIYIYLFPMIYISTCHMVSICVLVILVLHVCGKLSVLSYRIRNITFSSEKITTDKIRQIIDVHLKIIWMAKSVDDTFNLVLLDELLGNSIALAISLYNVLMNSSVSSIATFCTFILYAVTALVMLFGYCLVGDQLIQESMNVRNSIYECNWLLMSKESKRSLLICMIHAQTPLYLTAGKFYIFSLNGFTEVVKTSLAYLSVLRTLL